MRNCSHVNASEPLYKAINIGSDNSLVLSGNKPLPEIVLTNLSNSICHKHWSYISYSPTHHYLTCCDQSSLFYWHLLPISAILPSRHLPVGPQYYGHICGAWDEKWPLGSSGQALYQVFTCNHQSWGSHVEMFHGIILGGTVSLN